MCFLARKSRFHTIAFIDVLHAKQGGHTATFIVVFLGMKNKLVCTTFIVVPVLLIAQFSRQWLSTENEISGICLVAGIFFVFLFHCKRKIIRNKEELSNWFSPRVVWGFPRVILTKNHCVIFCVCG